MAFLGGAVAVVGVAGVGGTYLAQPDLQVGFASGPATPSAAPSASASAAPSASASPPPSGSACLVGTWKFTWVEMPYRSAPLSGRTRARLSITRRGDYVVDWDGSTPLTGTADGSPAETVIQGTDHEHIFLGPSRASRGTFAATGDEWSMGSRITHKYRGTTQVTIPGPVGAYTADYQCTPSTLTMSDSDGVRATAIRVRVSP